MDNRPSTTLWTTEPVFIFHSICICLEKTTKFLFQFQVRVRRIWECRIKTTMFFLLEGDEAKCIKYAFSGDYMIIIFMVVMEFNHPLIGFLKGEIWCWGISFLVLTIYILYFLILKSITSRFSEDFLVALLLVYLQINFIMGINLR